MNEHPINWHFFIGRITNIQFVQAMQLSISITFLLGLDAPENTLERGGGERKVAGNHKQPW